MTPHINAKPEDIHPYVLMPGDPVRAKFMAEQFLKDYKLINTVRGMSMYSGTYKGTPVTIAASGMGCPSIGIYSYELYKFYNVKCIIRVGTAGSYKENIKVLDLINVREAYGENDFAEIMLNINTRTINADQQVVEALDAAAKNCHQTIYTGKIHSSDVFYRPNSDDWKQIRDNENCLGVEMESFALFSNALFLKKQAGCILTVSDSFYNHVKLSSEDRVKLVKNMVQIGFEALLLLSQAG